MDIFPKNASPILKRNKKTIIKIPIFVPLLLKKLIKGPLIVPIIHAIFVLNELGKPSLARIN